MSSKWNWLPIELQPQDIPFAPGIVGGRDAAIADVLTQLRDDNAALAERVKVLAGRVDELRNLILAINHGVDAGLIRANNDYFALAERVKVLESQQSPASTRPELGAGAGNAVLSEPAPHAPVGEVGASSEPANVEEWPKYFRHVAREPYLNRFDSAESQSVSVPIGNHSPGVTTWDYQTAMKFTSVNSWLPVPRAEAEARIAAARGENTETPHPIPPLPAIPDDESGEPEDCEPVVVERASVVHPEQQPFAVGQVVECVDASPYCHMLKVGERYKVTRIYQRFDSWLIDTETHFGFYVSRFRAVKPSPSPAAPTPGMERAAKAIMFYTSTGQSGNRSLPDLINQHVGPELAALRAENERLKAEVDNLKDFARDLGGDELSLLRQQLATVTAERDEARKKLEQEEQDHLATIDERDRAVDAADRLAAIAGDESVIGEHSNTNDPWKNAAEILATAREAAEAMEWLTEHDYWLACLSSPNGDTPATFKKFWRIELLKERFPTPTAAILAAKNASERKEDGK